MNRSAFIATMKNSLVRTVKNVGGPLILEDKKRIQGAADVLLGISWTEICKDELLNDGTSMLFRLGSPVILSKQKEHIQALSGICRLCSSVLTVSGEEKVKCLQCGNSFTLPYTEGDVRVNSLIIELDNGTIYIGVKKET